jgi:AraC family transcriptional regulator of adaptative response / DNA-3-methyladenine glycosylase II
VTDRHLRRIFDAEYGVSLIEFAQTQRLLLAKRLLTDTSLPISQGNRTKNCLHTMGYEVGL